MQDLEKTVRELVPDALWERVHPLLPGGKPHPWGVCRARVADRRVLAGILFVLREGCRWRALDQTGICSGCTAHRRFQQWQQAGVFEALWRLALAEYDSLKGIDWEWLALDGVLTKAPLAGEKNRPQSDGSGENGHETQHFDGRRRGPARRGHRRSQPAGL